MKHSSEEIFFLKQVTAWIECPQFFSKFKLFKSLSYYLK